MIVQCLTATGLLGTKKCVNKKWEECIESKR
jgi:hypothetical protein